MDPQKAGERYEGDEHITEGISMADQITANILASCSPAARRVYGAMGCYLLPSVPIPSLARRCAGYMVVGDPITEEETRAALVELHSRGLAAFVDGDRATRGGTWDAKTTQVLFGKPGSVYWGWWVDRAEADQARPR